MSSPHPLIVIGGGHAGVEAAHAAARMGCEVRLLTLNTDALVRLSCNPAIGGIGKAHLVREIDAMGGLMGIAADLAGIHFRVLNRSRGPAVQGPRIQQDDKRYPQLLETLLHSTGRIELVSGEATRVITENGRLRFVETTEGKRFETSAVIVTSGTFLRGMLFRGDDAIPGGRRGEGSAELLSENLRDLGLRLERFKTGTPPRLIADSIDYERLTEQPGDQDPVPLSFLHLSEADFRPSTPQVMTHLAATHAGSHEIVRSALDRSPLYSGRIRARGPRYCPSFEDKVVKFPERDAHLLHVEPMGTDHPWVYLNGLSTSLPEEIQEELVHSISGLERARLARYGYAVEYDFAPPTQLHATLECRTVPGLFLAGQICGTTGYEEAAALGLIAGINAGRRVLGRSAWIPNRLESYLGVLVDDLTNCGVLEPYRMFTSRAELRLSLAPDTADRRMTPAAEALGLVAPTRARQTEARWRAIDQAHAALDHAGDLSASRPRVPADGIRRGDDPQEILRTHYPCALDWHRRDRETLIAALRYRGYLEIERREAAKLAGIENARIPDAFCYGAVSGLSTELRARLEEARPRTLGQASRLPGMTPAALALLAAMISTSRQAAS